MPNINTMKESKFLKKEDCGQGILVTIKEVSQENVAASGAPEELKWCLHFAEQDKPMVMNSTNAQLIAAIVKSEETDNWTGAKIVLYNEPTIMYAGKVIGGIRVRAPRGKAAQPAPAPAAKPVTRPSPAPAPVQQPDPEPAFDETVDDVPFN